MYEELLLNAAKKEQETGKFCNVKRDHIKKRGDKLVIHVS